MLGIWDIAFISLISIQVIVIAYVRHPKWKALMITIPFPFPLIYMAVGKPIDASQIFGIMLLVLFTHGVRIFHYRFKVPIVVSIVLSASGYVLLGLLLLKVVPFNETTFWVACAVGFTAGLLLLRLIPHREEQGGRTALPVRIKLPLTFVLVTLLVLVKQFLGGFTTVFPMVGVFAAYEARRSLWTMGRQIPVVPVTQIPMMIAIHLAEPRVGTGLAFVFGFGVFLVGFLIVQRRVLFGDWIDRRNNRKRAIEL